MNVVSYYVQTPQDDQSPSSAKLSSDPRLNDLWQSAQDHVETYKRLGQSCKEVSQHFSEVHDIIVVQEHKLKSQLEQQQSHMASLLSDIIDEVRLKVGGLSFSDKSDADVEQLVTNISSCTSMGEFMMAAMMANGGDNNKQELTTKCSDIDLLLCAQQHAQRLKKSKNEEKSVVVVQDVQLASLDHFRKNVVDTLAKLTPAVDIPVNHIFSANGTTFSLFSMTNSKWTSESIGVSNWIPFDNQTNAHYVYARGVIYWFTTGYCHMYSLKDRSYRALITTLGAYKAACYNGNEQIYIVEEKALNINNKVTPPTYQIYSININTMVFTPRGKPFSFEYASPLAIFINQRIYFFGEPCSILYFDTSDNSTSYILNHSSVSMYRGLISACYDGNDNFYMLFVGAFVRFSITNKLMYFLSLPPPYINNTNNVTRKIISHYHQSSGTIFYLFGKDSNMTYCTRTEKWSKLSLDNDLVASRSGYGSCLIPWTTTSQ
ncbi:hypothetical protein SAMD00019534_108560 [Acytostelium subglobosum LB1]|uniref:hypothetical protein n=1 Tax=Acytostelium subglobosum LB1 TaxID=1410327 RepID=UPI000644E703|nr:hypothetical protein SAMD00019534_108560 [Acytostelium subglobosum LB1]GAM27680.1 hypothetical protein SAMD00019534_108560 [Acytostelium subglobosum LB1]|eukprot:XP_012749339.1 hypothetical protein SAMD00019534_108560 [Acytostelium subglobosum LB1]